MWYSTSAVCQQPIPMSLMCTNWTSSSPTMRPILIYDTRISGDFTSIAHEQQHLGDCTKQHRIRTMPLRSPTSWPAIRNFALTSNFTSTHALCLCHQPHLAIVCAETLLSKSPLVLTLPSKALQAAESKSFETVRISQNEPIVLTFIRYRQFSFSLSASYSASAKRRSEAGLLCMV